MNLNPSANTKRNDYFWQIYNQDDENHLEPKEKEKPKERKPKFTPHKETEEELLDNQIVPGPHIDEEYSSKIVLQGGPPDSDFKLTIPSTFEECCFSPIILQNIRQRDYLSPSSIQKCIIPLIQKTKCDVMGQANTGTGKTAAFLLPLIEELNREHEKGLLQHNGHSPFVIIIAPTRELVRQLEADARSFALGTGVTIAAAYGDVPMGVSIGRVREGCDILVSTIGRVIHYAHDGIIKLNKVRYFVFDEADKLLENDEVLQGVRFLRGVDELPSNYRTLMFSATFYDQVLPILKEFLRPNYYFVGVGGINQAAHTVSQTVLKATKYEKKKLLLNVLLSNSKRHLTENGESNYDTERTIVFINGRRECDRLAILLAFNGFKVMTLNGNRTLEQRCDAVKKFKEGVYDILVSTSLAGRGLNFPNVSHVINYDMPRKDCPDEYIHRIGRTGRAGNAGRSTSFFDDKSEDSINAKYLFDRLEESNQNIPEFLKYIVEEQMKARMEAERYGKQPRKGGIFENDDLEF